MESRLLIITYYWPPAGGPGVQRWLKFVKYLAQLDREVIVVIPEHPDYPVIDDTLKDEVPESISIRKVPIQEPSRWASTLSRKRTKKLQKGILPQKPGLVQRLLIWVRGNLFIPDARVGWKPTVVNTLREYLNSDHRTTVITTGPPHSVHLIGMDLKQKYPKLKWITDFRDPWTTIGYHKHLKLGKRATQKHLLLEQQVLQECDQIIVTSPHTQNEFSHKTNLPIQLITNGYDRSISTATTQPDGLFTLAHIGTLLSDRNPVILWQSLAELCSELENFKEDLIIQFAGNVSDAVIQTINEYGLNDKLDLKGYLSHQEAYQLMCQAQALLLIEIDTDDTRAIIPGKIFEYFASRRPIIGIGPDDASVQSMIQETNTGDYFTYVDKQELKNHIVTLYRLFKNNENKAVQSRAIDKYHRKELTDQLNQLITSLWE